MTNQILEGKIIDLAAQFIYQSYGKITPEYAFDMAVGEAEVEFDTDINMKITNDIKERINFLARKYETKLGG